ncbi:MAG TPA: gamma-glutamylcyclotransferase family protein [Chitinophagaceae bacterium]
MTDSGIYQLFVYGSLRSGFHHQMFEYISRFFTFVGDAKVRGKLFDMGEYSAGVPVTDESFIVGELYSIKNISEFSWAMGQLDDYEGINAEPGEVQLYRRELAEVFVNDTTTRAWIYWFNGEVSGRPMIESGDLLKYMEQKKPVK